MRGHRLRIFCVEHRLVQPYVFINSSCRVRCPHCHVLNSKAWALAHPKRYAALRRNWAIANAAYLTLYRRGWRAKNKDRINAYKRRWRKERKYLAKVPQSNVA